MHNGEIPILVLAFNRAGHVAKTMKAICEYKPKRLYLACDGPHTDDLGERKAVEETRRTMLEAVDWPCETKTLFREENLGCANAVSGAIDWMFENEEYGIIVEDDMVIGIDFFRLCEDLLPRYANDERVMSIISQNHSGRKDIKNSYVYSYRGGCWGWATWRRAWAKMDMTMSAVPCLKYSFLIKRFGVFNGIMRMRNYRYCYKNIDTFDSWAYRWGLSICVNNGIVVVPGANLSKNIGTDCGAHFDDYDTDPYEHEEIGRLEWPLRYNDTFQVDKKQNWYDIMDFYRVKMLGLTKKIRKLLHLKPRRKRRWTRIG